MEVLIDTYK